MAGEGGDVAGDAAVLHALQELAHPGQSIVPPASSVRFFSIANTGSSRRRPTLTPQLPTTSVVTPCAMELRMGRFRSSEKSEWVWMSMKPGATARPETSIVRPAGFGPSGRRWP